MKIKLWQSIVTNMKKLKQEIFVLIEAYSDSRAPILAKLIIALAVGYFLSPIDLVPDFIPILGTLDDLLIIPILIWLAIKLLPDEVLVSARKKIISNAPKLHKNNWIFALIIVMIWLLLISLSLSYFFNSKIFS